MTANFFPVLQGFGVGAGLIVAIGAQNAFVLKQGLKRQHLFITAIICTLIDAVLISLGVAGFGTLVASHPLLLTVAKWGGVAFLLFYGLLSFRAVFSRQMLDTKTVTQSGSTVKKTILVLLALSLLNPHVYLDTFVLIGSIAAQHPADERAFFAIGAICASFVWFFSISYGARLLDPFFKSERAWQVLDIIIGVIMWGIAATLAFGM